MYVLLALIYWLLIPFLTLGVFFLFTPFSFHWWGLLIAFGGIFWAAISTAYLVIVGKGVPFSGKRAPTVLVTCGPYSMSRHPIYLSYFVYTLGLALAFDLHALIAVAVEVGVLLALMFFEEKRLGSKFEEFESYREKTSFFLPLSRWKIDDAKDPPFLFVFLYIVGKFLIKFFYDVRVEGKGELPNPPYLMVSNHNSYFDPFFIMDAMNFYVKAPLSWAHYDRMKWLIDHVGMFPIKRYTADSAAILKMVRAVRHKGTIGIFIENERSWDGRPLNVKNGVEHLVKTLKVPLLPVRIERAHLMWPRWSPKFHKGWVKVVISKSVPYTEYKRAFDFVLKDTVPQDEVYKDYRGIESYLWKCPKCGVISSLTSFKKGFTCLKCESVWDVPTVGEVRKMHDENYPSDLRDLPLEDMADVNGREVRVSLDERGISLGGTYVSLKEVKAFLVESRKELYLYTGKLYEIRPHTTSVLMWKEYMDVLKKNDEDYWSYK